MFTTRSADRSISAVILSAEITWRRSLATGAWSASIWKQRSSISMVRASISSSERMRYSAPSRSWSSRICVARGIISVTVAAVRTSFLADGVEVVVEALAQLVHQPNRPVT